VGGGTFGVALISFSLAKIEIADQCPGHNVPHFSVRPDPSARMDRSRQLDRRRLQRKRRAKCQKL